MVGSDPAVEANVHADDNLVGGILTTGQGVRARTNVLGAERGEKVGCMPKIGVIWVESVGFHSMNAV